MEGEEIEVQTAGKELIGRFRRSDTVESYEAGPEIMSLPSDTTTSVMNI